MFNYTPNCGQTWEITAHKGIIFYITQSPNNAPLFTKTIRKNSFQYQSLLLFNSLPKNIRNSESDMEGWKTILDKFLDKIPNLPVTSQLDSGLYD